MERQLPDPAASLTPAQERTPGRAVDAHSALTPVFMGLRLALHALMVGLTLFVLVRASIAVAETGSWSRPGWIIALCIAFLATYAAGRQLRAGSVLIRSLWLGGLTLEWLILALLTPDAAFLVFPLFFLYLHLLTRPWNVLAVVAATAAVIVLLGLSAGWGFGAILGPVIGATVAVVIGLGYQALFTEARQREQLIADLIATRSQLAATEREAGVMAERERLAREIHDTVAQGLSSIQILLHAVERADENHPAIAHVRLARETAATDLAEARRLVQELKPPALEDHNIEGALRRLAATATQTAGTIVNVRVSGEHQELPMNIATGLLRIAQGSLANVAQHADAKTTEITLSYMGDSVSLDIVDDGRGFEPRQVIGGPNRTGESFGFQAIQQRVTQLGGSVAIESAPGRGTAVAVSLPVPVAGAEEGAVP